MKENEKRALELLARGHSTIMVGQLTGIWFGTGPGETPFPDPE